MKWHEFWIGVWLMGWMFTLGMLTAQSEFWTSTLWDRAIVAVLALIAWPGVLGLVLGQGGALR
jgi:hypothetical protein